MDSEKDNSLPINCSEGIRTTSRTERVREELISEAYRGKLAQQHTSAILDQYKLYLELLDRISQRRQTANQFFLSINTGLCALVGYFFSKDTPVELKTLFFLVPFAGIWVSYFWFRMVRSYRDLTTAKFAVVHAIEQLLPLTPYHCEWIALGEGKDSKLYTPFTHLEIWVPRCFMLMHSLLVVWFVPWLRILNWFCQP